jgi:predicted nucleic acid-binding protein
MPYLIDTCIISELRKPHCNSGVASWMTGVEPDNVFLSVITLGEIRRGIENLRPKDAKTADGLERWLAGLESHYGDRILPISAAVADRWGRLSPAQPLPVSDGLIAATALEHKLTVATRNVSDFQRSGAGTFNPFS